MSERYKLLLVLINTLERMSIKYHLVNCMHPSDKDTTIRVGDHPRANYFIVNNNGITYTTSPLNSDVENYKTELLASAVMAAASVQITQ